MVAKAYRTLLSTLARCTEHIRKVNLDRWEKITERTWLVNHILEHLPLFFAGFSLGAVSAYVVVGFGLGFLVVWALTHILPNITS